MLSRQRWLMAMISGRSASLPKDETGLQLVTAPFNPNVDRREMISAGAAAGIAAAFGESWA
jgi:hypothetical protein